MGASLTCTYDLGQRTTAWLKRWAGAVAGEFLDGRTRRAIARICNRGMVLQGGTAEIECTVEIGKLGDVKVRLEGLPDQFGGTKPYLTFPASAQAEGISWWAGPQRTIVHAKREVSPEGELTVPVAFTSRTGDDLARLFGKVRILSEGGNGEPATSIEISLDRPQGNSGKIKFY